MESNEISMFMDVKLDINERKREKSFRSWSKCLVKMEAIKCFPCYFRITFISDVENPSENLCVRINVPGITVRQAISRTKTHSYGVFWKQNRKRCCIFLSLDSAESCDLHMKWIQMSIKNLELHRKEILETRRVSRFQQDPEIESAEKKGRNMQDILGPLPRIPDFGDSSNPWSRRVSGFSGIYEEIQDGDVIRRISRNSVASGIYEEMKPPANTKPLKADAVTSTPPPLPPRKRLNTYQSDEPVRRCYTNPETELTKKKKYLGVLENMFGKSKRSLSVSEGQVSTAEELMSIGKPNECNVESLNKGKNDRINNIILKNKRNSFSSPDLSKISKYNGPNKTPDDISSFSSDLQMLDLSDTTSFENLDFFFDEPAGDVDMNSERYPIFNISTQIQPNFNISFNSSTINLVGANLHLRESSVKQVMDDLSGYCVMAPILKSNAQSSNDSDKENDNNVNKADAVNTTIYEHINFEEHTYQNLSGLQNENDACDSPNSSKVEPGQIKRKSNNFDDKIPSYYPNNCDAVKVRKRLPSGKHVPGTKSNHKENLYISPPERIGGRRKKCETQLNQQKSAPKSTPLRACKIGENVYAVSRATGGERRVSPPKQGNKIVSISIENANSDSEITNQKDSSPRMHSKYATIARLSPNKCAKKPTDFGAVKKFASLPRFKKIDFSPLKIKINSVLQRHQSDGF